MIESEWRCMSRRARLIRRLQQRWLARFGQPPAIRAAPELMEKILEEDERRTAGDIAAKPWTADPG